jgi:hypothetical protein
MIIYMMSCIPCNSCNLFDSTQGCRNIVNCKLSLQLKKWITSPIIKHLFLHINCSFRNENALMTSLGFINVSVYIWAHPWFQCHYHHGFDYRIHKMDGRASQLVQPMCLLMCLGCLYLKWWSMGPLSVPLLLFMCSWSRGVYWLHMWLLIINHWGMDISGFSTSCSMHVSHVGRTKS